MRKYDLPREMRDILNVYEMEGKDEISRQKLRRACAHLPTKTFEEALMEMVLLGILEIKERKGRIYYRLKRYY